MGIYPAHIFLLLRRFIAFAYDAFLLVSVLFIVGGTAVTLNGGEAVNALYLAPISLLVSYIFFGWFWTHGGQTLGMRAWQIKLTDREGLSPTWLASFWRFLVMFGLFGLGTVWVVFDAQGQSLQDKAARLILHKKPKRLASSDITSD